MALEEQELSKALCDLPKLSQEILEDIENLSSHQIQKVSENLEQAEKEIKPLPIENKKKRTLTKLKKKFKEDFLPRYQKYENYLSICGPRKSFSKTDPDATFLRMKEDHMRNGQLKPGYNIQIGTNEQFILHYTLHPNPTDTRTFAPHMDSLKTTSLPPVQNIIADAGYGSEENDLYCFDHNLEPLIPYNQMRKEHKRTFKKEISKYQNWKYFREEDYFLCPSHRFVEFKRYTSRTNAYGYKQEYKLYECESCKGCPIKKQCTKAKNNRQVRINPVYEECKAKARENLIEKEKTKTIYSKRKIEPESVFGNLKANLGCQKFRLRGKEKVNVEFGLLSMAHNLIKEHKIREKVS